MISKSYKTYAGCEFFSRRLADLAADGVHFRLSPNQIQKLLNQYLVADYEQPIHGDIMKAVASKVTEKGDVLLLTAVDMEDSGPYEIAEPRVITALETYTPSWLQTPRLKRLAEIVSAQAVAQQEKLEFEVLEPHDNGEDNGHAEVNDVEVEPLHEPVSTVAG